jgi:XTP/dITP diphosphohydrolase
MAESDRLCLITGNAGKAAEFERLLGRPIDHQKVPLLEPQALDVREVSAHKATQAFEHLQRPVLVDDTALVIEAWNGLPGALVSWFLDSVGCDGIIQMASSIGDRSASVTTALGFADANGTRVFLGQLRGQLPLEPRGTEGFGYDPIFVPDGSDKTFAEMSAEEKDAGSMRRLAVDELCRELDV